VQRKTLTSLAISVHTIPVIKRPIDYRTQLMLASTQKQKQKNVLRSDVYQPYNILVGEPEGKWPLGRSRYRWQDNIRMDFTK